MSQFNTARRTALFIAFFALAGVANMLRLPSNYPFNALMMAANYLIYVGLLLYWIQSVRARLLPSAERRWILSAGSLMLLHILIRIFKYAFTKDVAAMRWAVYLYFVPMELATAFFLMTCLRIRRGGRPGRWNEALLLIPATLLVLLALTNDWHFWVYRPNVPLSQFKVDGGTYAYGPGFYLLYGWLGLSLAAGLLLLFREMGRLPRRALIALLAATGAWAGIGLVFILILEPARGPRPYNNPEVNVFGLLSVFEVCIRGRLIPRNENYPGFFSDLQFPSLITDRQFRPVYRSSRALEASQEALRAALDGSVHLTPDTRLSGRTIRAGYAFWTEDERAVHRAQERLAEANELIESENSLIQAETEQKEKDAYLQSRHRIYHDIAAQLYPCQQRIERLLADMTPDAPDFDARLARVCVLNAYVKRKTNLLLLAAEQDALSMRDLFLALEESGRYLTLAGLKTAVQPGEEAPLPAPDILSLYDGFEAVAEMLMGRSSALMVSIEGKSLTLAAQTEWTPQPEGLPVKMRMKWVESTLYLTLTAGKGGEPA